MTRRLCCVGMPRLPAALVTLSLILPSACCGQEKRPAETVTVVASDLNLSGDRLAVIDEIVDEGLRRAKMPGCVVMVGRRAGVGYLKAFGNRQLVPVQQQMTVDTVFDMASLTKPVVTATSIMLLIEDGRLSLDDRVAKYLPEFGGNGKQQVTVQDLLTHTAGLIPDNPLADYLHGREAAFQKIDQLELRSPPGEKFSYTDVGFITLGRLVEQVSGQTLEEFSRQRIFEPLQMHETGFNPGKQLQKRAAVTQQREGRWMQGEVHDPRAYALGGVAGHAGLFSTAHDLSRYARMLLNGGELDGVRVMKAQTVAMMTAPVEVPSGLRTLGWDMRSAYSSNRGDLMSAQAFGHGGFTGTAMWIDPTLDLYVIFLSNRVHPDGKGSVNALAGRIGTVAAAAVCRKCP